MILALLFLSWPMMVGAEVEPVEVIACELLAAPGGVICVEGGDEVEILHPTLFGEPGAYREREGGAYPAGPVEVDGFYYYGVKQDLLRFDPVEVRIDRRLRFPSVISRIEVEGEELVVRLDGAVRAAGPSMVERAGEEEVDEIAVRFSVSEWEAVGRGYWEWVPTMGIVHDVMWLKGIELLFEPGATTQLPGVDEASERRLIEMLEERERLDQTNPFLLLYRAEALERLGDVEEANRAYHGGAELEQAHWLDLMRVGMRLEYRGQQEAAASAFDAASEGLERSGVRGDSMTSMISLGFGVLWFREVVEQAIARGDVEGASRVSEQVAGAFSNMEGSGAAWMRLAAFADAEGASEVGDSWRERVDEGASVTQPGQFFGDAARAVDLFLVLEMGLFLAALLCGVILGLRRRKRWTDLPMVGVLFLALVAFPLIALPTVVVPAMQNMATVADAPAAVMSDGLAAPVAKGWLEGLYRSPASAELIAVSDRERDAMQSGGVAEGEVDVKRLLVEAVEADTKQRGPSRFDDVEVSRGVVSDFEWMGTLSELKFSKVFFGMVFLMLLINAAVFGRLLQIVARRFEKFGVIGRAIVVGAPDSLGVFRIPVFAIFVVGLLMISPLSQAVEAATNRSLASYYGMGEAPAVMATSSLQVGAICLSVALVAHGVGILLDRRSVSE